MDAFIISRFREFRKASERKNSMCTIAECEALFEQVREHVLAIKDVVGDRQIDISFDAFSIRFQWRENLSDSKWAWTETTYTPPISAQTETTQRVFGGKEDADNVDG